MSAEQVIHKIAFGEQREKGPVREENQDQIGHFQSTVFGHVFVVADGMGGHEGGGIAANMAITGFRQHFQAVSRHMPLRESIAEAARLTNLDIFDTSTKNGDTANPLRMGSTLVLCVLAGNQCTIASAGDSRCYLFRNGELRRLTKDHTAVQKMIDSGMISADEAKTHPDASVLTRAFGQRPELEIDIYDPFLLAPDEELLLCSDGLHGYVDEADIADSLQRHSDPQAAADALVQLALHAGGQDNISVYVIRVDPGARGSAAATGAADQSRTQNPLPEAETTGASGAVLAAPVPEGDTARLPPLSPEPSPKPVAPAPIRPKAGRRIARALMLVAIAIVAGALFVNIWPQFLPVAVRDWLSAKHAPAAIRDRLVAWGIVAEDPRISVADAPAVRTNPNPPVDTASGGADTPAPDTPEPKPAVGPVPIVASGAAPTVFIAIPPGANDGFRRSVARFQDRIRAAGFSPMLDEIPVQPGSVWRFVTANPATFVPSQTVISAVFLPGFQQEAVKVCGIVGCPEPPREVSPANHRMFESAFDGGSIALLVHPKSVGREPPPESAVPEEHPKVPTKE